MKRTKEETEAFAKWLNECPVVWLLVDQNNLYSTLRFYIETENEKD